MSDTLQAVRGIEFPSVPGIEFRYLDEAKRYSVACDGSVWTRSRFKSTVNAIWRRLKPSLNGHGYLVVVVPFCGRRRTVAVHRLVAHCFVGARPDGKETRHIDGNKLNNAASNLTYGTKSENTFDAMRHGKHSNLRVGGEGNPKAKLTAIDVREIRRLASSGNSPAEIFRTGRFPVGRSAIQRVVNGSSWNAATNGGAA